MEPTVQTLMRVHRALLARVERGEVSLRPIADSVPRLASLSDRYTPEADAIILSRRQLRDLVAAVIVDVIDTQAAGIDSHCADCARAR